MRIKEFSLFPQHVSAADLSVQASVYLSIWASHPDVPTAMLSSIPCPTGQGRTHSSATPSPGLHGKEQAEEALSPTLGALEEGGAGDSWWQWWPLGPFPSSWLEGARSLGLQSL